MINYYSFSSNKFGLSLRLLGHLDPYGNSLSWFPCIWFIFVCVCVCVSKIITLFILFSPLELDGVIL